MSQTFYCTKCGRTMDESNFYGSFNTEKYPTGKLTECKKCVTMFVDNWNPDTYLWILQEIDIPYVPDEWHKLMEKYCKDPSKVTGTTILGRYISKMRLKQWKDYRWSDTEFLQELNNAKIEQAMKQQGFGAAEITQAINKATIDIPAEAVRPVAPEGFEPGPTAAWDAPPTEIDIDLTEEDKTYLQLKWGRSYRPHEWVQLEQLYNDMLNSYDVQGAGHLDTLKLMCKTSLKANQLIDMNDIEGYQKMSKVYDQLMKSGKFTAAQNKGEGDEYVDSVGELVAICERDGFIPRFYVAEPNDQVDKVVLDMQKYTYNLVTEEMGLGNLIENALKKIEKEREQNLESDEDIDEDEDLFTYKEDEELSDQDFTDFKDFEESLEQEDE